MKITDEQWLFIQPLIPPPPSAALRGRPPIDERSVLNGILWKLCTNSPWYNLPDDFPSWQTCFRRYHLWQRTGVMQSILTALFQDLHTRGGLDIHKAFTDGTFQIANINHHIVILMPSHLKNTWQLSVATLFIRHALKKLRNPLNLIILWKSHT